MRLNSIWFTPGWLCLVSGICLVFGGCSVPAQQSIPTHAATGVVLMADGQPLAGGLIEFNSLDNPSVTITGLIADDGTFTLTTMLDGARVDGAVAGECRVTVIPLLDDTAAVQAVGQTFTLPDTCEIQAGEDNSFTITLPKGG